MPVANDQTAARRYALSLLRIAPICISLVAAVYVGAVTYAAPEDTLEPDGAVEPKIYVTHYRFGAPLLHVMNRDGGNVQELKFIPAEDWLIVGIHVDLESKTIYWINGDHMQRKLIFKSPEGFNSAAMALVRP
jgi:hypothetical protein